jgi:hypothetical protein
MPMKAGFFGKDHLERFTFSINGQTKINDRLTVEQESTIRIEAPWTIWETPLKDIVNLPETSI